MQKWRHTADLARYTVNAVCLLLIWPPLALFAQNAIPPSVFQRVNADFQRGQLAAAEVALRTALKGYPRDPHALGMLGVVLDAEKKYNEAGTYYAEALRSDPHSPSILNNLGNHYLALRDFTRARQAYLGVVAIDPHHSNANLQLARMAVAAKQRRQALHYLSELPPAAGDQPAVKLLRAQTLHLAGQTTGAEILLGEVEKEGARDPRVAFTVGMIEVGWKEYKEAEQSLRLALDADPANFDILYNLGLAALKAGDLQTARQTLEEAILRCPDDVDTLYNLAWLESQTGHNDRAIARLVRAHQLDPRRPDVMLLTGQVSDNLGFYGDAAEAFHNYLKLKPKDDVVRREYGFALAHTPKIDQAVTVLRDYMNRHPKDARGFYELGVAESVHNQERSVQDLKRAIVLDPNLAAAKYALGDVLYQGGHFHQAADVLRPFIHQEPDNYRALDVLGEAELQLDDVDPAVKYLGRAAQLAPRNRKVLLQYGQALERAHQHQKALAVLERFQQLPPAAPRPYSGLVDYLSMPYEQQRKQYLQHLKGRMQLNPLDTSLKVLWAKAMLAQGKTGAALQTFDQILAQHPGAPNLEQCGMMLLGHGQYAEARRFFSQFALLAPSQPGNILNLSIAVFHTSGPEAALTELDRTPLRARRGDYYLLRAQILDAIGQAQEAANALTLGLKADPSRPDIYFQAALFLIKHNQASELLVLLRQAVAKFPNSRQLLLTQAIAYGLMRRSEKSNQVMSRIETRWPEWSEAYLIHGIMLVGQAKMNKAKPLLETAIAMGNRDPSGYYNLALCDMEIFPLDVSGAAKAIKVALKLDPSDPYTQSLAGKIAFTQKDYPAALEHLRAAIHLWPDMIEARETLSGTYRALGQRQKSATELEAILRIKQRTRSPDQAPPSHLKNLLFAVPAPAPSGG